MGTDRVYWDDRKTQEEILKVKDFLDIDRMPSKSEIETFYNNSKLINHISKTGGFYHWAKILGLEVKKSETGLGFEMEKHAMNELIKLGNKCELTSTRFPYDLLVNGRVKIDVKTGNKTKAHGYNFYSFNLEKKQQTCDLYIVYCLGENKNIEKTYIIPAHIMTGKSQLSLGLDSSKYDRFINRWDIIKSFDLAFKEIS